MTIDNKIVLTSQSASITDLPIERITEPLILRYFQTMNAQDYQGTAALFAPTGVMHPPFEEPIEGPEAIAIYLEAEAKGMELLPERASLETLEDGNLQVQVRGKVQTPLFGVNVAWIYILNPEREILYTKIKLLASPQELLNLRR